MFATQLNYLCSPGAARDGKSYGGHGYGNAYYKDDILNHCTKS